MSDQVLARLSASPFRRWFGIVSLVFLGGLLLYVTVATPPAPVWQLLLIALGAGAMMLAHAMYRATALSLTLTRDALVDSEGTEIAKISEIRSVERGAFAMKPSNGFVLNMHRPQARRWRPGLYWSLGTRVAVGGVTPGHQAKPMADAIAILLAERGRDEA
ncbi:hypothetical protein FIU97_14000 [Roseivivax sp. THAF40]|uniref:hypothetical protein n=1 Tax=unclassified Roseivivax TaxID=2639302 RepID=UPI0012690E50|nr:MULTISPECIES: hypothetical protein [unclassified Roseivivax]QFS83857.1 hypothetical protein FIV09_13560 [Roseivivax sp. THAF197b]QFT47689.1 hypothetical protein FIU97_14000 [Roseivivax sp. THAF40]